MILSSIIAVSSINVGLLIRRNRSNFENFGRISDGKLTIEINKNTKPVMLQWNTTNFQLIQIYKGTKKFDPPSYTNFGNPNSLPITFSTPISGGTYTKYKLVHENSILNNVSCSALFKFRIFPLDKTKFKCIEQKGNIKMLKDYVDENIYDELSKKYADKWKIMYQNYKGEFYLYFDQNKNKILRAETTPYALEKWYKQRYDIYIFCLFILELYLLYNYFFQ